MARSISTLVMLASRQRGMPAIGKRVGNCGQRAQFSGKFCAFGLILAVFANPVSAFEDTTGNVPAPGGRTGSQSGDLPSGDSDAIRDRMTNWRVDPQLRSKIVESINPQSSAQRLSVSSPFGWRTDPLTGGGRRHPGVDLPGRTGSNVYATGPGRIVSAGWVSGYGNMIEIGHPDGLRTRYGHLSKIMVAAGSTVEQGELIGKVGSTGRSTGPHLHYEVRARGVPIDPQMFMGQSTPRYEAQWAPEPKAEPRWEGWVDAKTNSLPQAVIE